jgi:RNA polymerase sigma factor (sigma-70 family)
MWWPKPFSPPGDVSTGSRTGPAFGRGSMESRARRWRTSVGEDVRRARLAGRLRASERVTPPANAEGEVATVAAAFARLSEDDREVLALVAWEELDAEEVATVLGCSRNAARIRLHRARRRLARELAVGRDQQFTVRRAEAR